jgi:hypothetical protein
VSEWLVASPSFGKMAGETGVPPRCGSPGLADVGRDNVCDGGATSERRQQRKKSRKRTRGPLARWDQFRHQQLFLGRSAARVRLLMPTDGTGRAFRIRKGSRERGCLHPTWSKSLCTMGNCHGISKEQAPTNPASNPGPLQSSSSSGYTQDTKALYIGEHVLEQKHCPATVSLGVRLCDQPTRLNSWFPARRRGRWQPHLIG